MSHLPSNSSQQISDYQTQPPEFKAMLQIMAVNIEPCRVMQMIDCLKDLGFIAHNGKKLISANFKPWQDKLLEQKLMFKSTLGISCPESIRQQALRELLLSDNFSKIADIIKKNISLPDTQKKYNPFKNYQQLIRSFQIAIFTHNSMTEIDSLVNNFTYNFFHNEYYSDKNPYLHILNNPFSPKIIEKIDPEIRLEVLTNLLKIASSRLAPARAICNYITSNYPLEITSKTIALTIAIHYLVCGDTSSARSLLESFDDSLKPEQLSRMGWLEFICGNNEKALKLFAQDLTLLKKLNGKRKLFLQSTAGLFHLLALLKSNEHKHHKEALDYIDIAQKNKYSLAPLMGSIKAIFQDQLGLNISQNLEAASYDLKEEPLVFFFDTLTHAWRDKIYALRKIPKLKQLRDNSRKNGYTWLEAELSALLAYLGNAGKKNHEIAAKLHKSCSTVSLIDMVKEQPQWEKTLNALLHLTPDNNNKTAKNAHQEQRLIWLFKHSETSNYCSITPRLQKMSKNGSWTKGRPVALKTLYHDLGSLSGITDHDRRICQTIKEEYYRTSWRYGKSEYDFDDDITLPALVGHPLLFLEESPGVRVELVLSEPEMHIKKEKGKLKLSLFPTIIDTTSNIQVVKDTPTRFKIIRFTEAHKQIINLLNKETTIPKTGEKLVYEVMDSLSSLVTIHSDLDTGKKTKAIKADSRPHAHLIPYQDGIQLEFLVKPCGGDGSSFRAGKGGKNVLTEIKGKKVQAIRDFAQEKRARKQIIQACATLNHLEEIENRWVVDDPEDSLELLLELKECDDKVILEWPQGEKIAVRKEVSGNNFSLQIKSERDWFQATGSLKIDDKLALDLRQLMEMLNRSTGRFIPLDDGTFLTITRQLRKRLNDLRAFSEEHGKGVRFAPLAAFALEELTDEAGELKSDQAWKQHCKHLNEVVTPKVPSTLHATLRDYQKTGFNWLAQLSHWGVGGCLADDMGLGKTVQALAAILLRAAQGPTLVIAPLSVTSNWQDEARRFAPTLNIIVFGPGDRKETINNLQPFDLLISSYGLLPLESELLASVKWQTVVLDEAQAIKNMQTKRSRAAMQLQAQFRIITTGTPVENHTGELWTLYNFLNPGLLGSFKKFNEKFALPIERDQDSEARNRLRKLIRPFILRRLKSDVLQELPAKTEITLNVEMSPEELLLYEAQRLQALENISAHDDEGAGQNHLRILGEIMRLRRLCCNPSLILPDCKIPSSKLKVFANTLNELLENNHKALIFSQFVDHLHIIRDFLDEQKITYQYLDGSTPIKKRQERIKNFQNGEGDVFLISLKAGGAGLNLTAADYVIHMDPWWNPAVEDQASDRAHRIGQKRPVTVYRLVVKNSIEEQIVDLHKQKRDLASSLLEGTDITGRISASELLALLRD